MPQLGPYSRNSTLRKLDGRSREGRLIKSLRAELERHVGGSPSITQQILIEQACSLRLRIAMMEAEQAESDDPGRWPERRQVQFLAWTSALTRLLREIGLEGVPQKPTSLDEFDWTHLSHGEAA